MIPILMRTLLFIVERRGQPLLNVGRAPVLKPCEVVGLLERLGVREARQRGPHRQYRHPDGRATTVPFHGNRDISPILLRQIARDLGLTEDARSAHTTCRSPARLVGATDYTNGSKSGSSTMPAWSSAVHGGFDGLMQVRFRTRAVGQGQYGHAERVGARSGTGEAGEVRKALLTHVGLTRTNHLARM
jgi:predicted RNA binding protein YcfA (HicA-like mRNA interferase family)